MTRIFILICMLIGSSLHAATYYVATNGNDTVSGLDWANALKTISNGVAKAAGDSGGTVLVSNGTYVLTSTITATNDITVISLLGKAQTIVDGNNAKRCFYIYTNAVVDGFTITRGYTGGNGGGAYCDYGGIVRNCTISDCTGLNGGGGMYLYHGGKVQNSTISGCSAIYFGGGLGCRYLGLVTNCTIISNIAVKGAGVFAEYGGFLMQNSLITENSTFQYTTRKGGVGGVDINGECIVENCTISYNQGQGYYMASAGLYIQEGALARNCSIIGNVCTQYYGGGVSCYGTLRNCLVAGNTCEVQFGGGVVLPPGTGKVENCTIVYNSAKNIGGGVYFYAGTTVTNSIIYFNRTPSGTGNSNYWGSSNFSYSCTAPLPDGPGNVSDVPQFIDSASDNYRLLYTSPCIDKGTTNVQSMYTNDFDGRVHWDFNGDGTNEPDMGCYEWSSAAPLVNPNSFTNTMLLTNNATNEFQVWHTNTLYGTTLYYQITLSADCTNWLTTSVSTGMVNFAAQDTVILTNDSFNLPAGTYTGNVTITPLTPGWRVVSNAPTTNVQVVLDVVMDFIQSPSALTNCVLQGLTATSQTFEVWNAGAGTVSYTNTLSANWLQVWPVTGVSTGVPVSNTNVFTLTYTNTANLSVGSHTGVVSMKTDTIGGSTQTVTVVMKVIDMAAQGLTNLVMAGQNAGTQQFDVVSTGAGTMDYTLSTNQAWLSVEPVSGTLTNSDTNTITVSYHTTSLSPGAHIAVVTAVASAGGGAMTQMVEVLMNVMWPGWSPASLSQEMEQGGNPTNQVFEVWNSGAGPMSYTLSDNVSWLSLSTGSGMSTGEHDFVSVIYGDMSGFTNGTYTGTVSIVASDGGLGATPSGTTQTFDVAVTVITPSAPPDIYASDGTDTDKVMVNWGLSTGAVNYEVWRCLTFDVDYASKLAEVSVTNYIDSSASPGKKYYYWVRPVNTYGVPGTMSSNDSGYCALSAPAGIFASDGTYTNKVRITWSASDGATTYEVYRAIEEDSITNVFHASGIAYDDTQVTGGKTYTYRVKAMNSRYASALSGSDAGYILSHPSSVTASDGAYVGQVRVQWSSVDSATGYEVWRADRGVIGFAESIGNTTGTNYSDTSVTAGTVYYYWVRAKNATATGGFSAQDSGYAGADSADLFVWDIVVLPNTIGTLSHPSVVSFRMGNKGPDALISPNTAVGMDFYASTNTTFGDDDDILIGQIGQDVMLSAGTNTIVKVSDVSELTLPAAAGDYYIFVSVNHKYPSTLVDTNLADNMAMRAGAINVSESGSLFYQAINDYDGDGVSDLALYYGGYWYIRSVDGRVIAYGAPWGTPEMVPVFGDYDGDKVSDLAVYGNGLWYARTVAGSVILWGASLGGTGFSPVYGDFTGTGSADMAVYVDSTGAWYILEPGVGVVLWGNDWGGAGFVPVPGDYDGDGTWDMAVYNEETGAWYVRTVSGVLLLWGESWGGLGYEPVSGDYNGDGLWDMAVYYEETGYWFIRTVSGGTVLWAQKFGETGYAPVYGDYNGDGISDIAVYHEATGKWYIRSVDGTILLWDSLWGSPGYVPVGR